MNLKGPIVFVFGLFMLFNANSQEDPEFLFGKLMDSKTKEPVVFATVRLKGMALGVISDSEGIFRVPRFFLDRGDALVISCMGYENKRVTLESLGPDEVTVIELLPGAIALDESVVMGKRNRKRLSAEKIVQFAINNIMNNYPDKLFRYVGYYRDYQLKDQEYYNLNEGILEVQDYGFQLKDPFVSKFLLYDFKNNLDFKVDSFAIRPYDYESFEKTIPNATLDAFRNNELMLLRIHDPIRNHAINTFSFVNVLSSDFIKNHIFSLQKNSVYNQKPIYRIGVSNELNEDIRVKGTLFIDKSNYAIRRFDYAVYKKETKIEGALSHSSMGFSTTKEELIFQINLEYREGPDNKMYPNYISFHNEIKLIRPPEFQIEEVILNKDFMQAEIYLNRPAANWEDVKFSDFKLNYNGKKVKLVKVIDRDLSTYLLKIDTKNQRQLGLVNQLFSSKFDPDKALLEIEIKKMKDKFGNELGYRKRERLSQFREFFVQEVLQFNPNETKREKRFMDTSLPLHHKNQSINSYHGEQKYWMNTPLKSKE